MATEGPSASSASAIRAADNAVSMTIGVIKKVDKEAAKLTIQHGKLKNLDMPAMTMVFRVMHLSMLDQVKIGDQVNFVADSIDGKLVITMLELNK